VRLEFKHNVNGRKVYAEGTVDAAVFLAGVVRNGDGGDKRVFDMVDVLKAGAMV
jgi:4-hydroxy-tetrahydrodipicolinate reductase